MGRASLRALEGAAPELAKATCIWAVIFAYASSRDEFERELRRVVRESEAELVDLEDAGPVHEMLDVDEEKMRRALETAETGDPTVHFYLSDEPADAVDEDWAVIREAAASGDAVEHRLLGSDHFWEGFVVSVGETWAIVNVVNPVFVAFDGYEAVRFDSVMDADVITEEDTFVLAALERRGEQPSDPGLPLDDHRSLLAALASRYPLVALKDATGRDETLAVGRILSIGDDAVTLRRVDPAGQWTGEHVHAYKNIVAIRFGSAYNESLAQVLG
jgi:hypothetical protein